MKPLPKMYETLHLNEFGSHLLDNLQNVRQSLYLELRRSKKLRRWLQSQQQQAQEQFDSLVIQLRENDPPPENDYLGSVAKIELHYRTAREIVLREMIHVLIVLAPVLDEESTCRTWTSSWRSTPSRRCY